MFANPQSPRHARGALPGGLYQQVGVETGTSGASPHQLVAMLFDGWMQAVAQARGAMRAGDAAAKGLAIGRAVRIVEDGLRGGLNLTAGGSLARDLDDLYNYLTMRLTVANLRNDEHALTQCVTLMQPLHEAWTAIGPSTTAGR